MRRSALPLFGERMEQAGLEPPSFDVDRFGSPDEDVAASIDCREHATAKLDALAAHASQQDNIFFLRIPLADFTEMFGREEFIRLRDPPPTALHLRTTCSRACAAPERVSWDSLGSVAGRLVRPRHLTPNDARLCVGENLWNSPEESTRQPQISRFR